MSSLLTLYIQNYLKENNIRMADLVRLAGYKNVSKGMKRIPKILESEFFDQEQKELLNKIQLALNIDADVFNQKVLESRQDSALKRWEVYAQSFSPCVKILTERSTPDHYMNYGNLKPNVRHSMRQIILTENFESESIEDTSKKMLIFLKNYDLKNLDISYFWGAVTGFIWLRSLKPEVSQLLYKRSEDGEVLFEGHSRDMDNHLSGVSIFWNKSSEA